MQKRTPGFHDHHSKPALSWFAFQLSIKTSFTPLCFTHIKKYLGTPLKNTSILKVLQMSSFYPYIDLLHSTPIPPQAFTPLLPVSMGNTFFLLPTTSKESVIQLLLCRYTKLFPECNDLSPILCYHPNPGHYYLHQDFLGLLRGFTVCKFYYLLPTPNVLLTFYPFNMTHSLTFLSFVNLLPFLCGHPIYNSHSHSNIACLPTLPVFP